MEGVSANQEASPLVGIAQVQQHQPFHRPWGFWGHLLPECEKITEAKHYSQEAFHE